MTQKLACFVISVLPFAVRGNCVPGQVTVADPAKRMVLVELYTSQGCDIYPAAEKILGALAEKASRVVPIAFHIPLSSNPVPVHRA